MWDVIFRNRPYAITKYKYQCTSDSESVGGYIFALGNHIMEHFSAFSGGLDIFDPKIALCYCSVSRGRPHKVDKRMVLEYTHGLFIT
jgi:hypothetical protein